MQLKFIKAKQCATEISKKQPVQDSGCLGQKLKRGKWLRVAKAGYQKNKTKQMITSCGLKL